MKHAITLALVAALSGCSFGGASLQPFPAPEQPAPEGYAQVRLFVIQAHGALGGRLGLGNADGRADGCVVTIIGAEPQGSVSLSNGECEYKRALP